MLGNSISGELFFCNSEKVESEYEHVQSLRNPVRVQAPMGNTGTCMVNKRYCGGVARQLEWLEWIQVQVGPPLDHLGP